MKQKRILALALAGAMLMSQSAVFAATNNVANGDSVVENDNSTKPNIKTVVLPTINDTTYDFTIDRSYLLPQYDATGKYDGSTVYFNAVAAPAYIYYGDAEAPTQIYEKTYVETSAEALLYQPGSDTALFAGKKATELSTILTTGYYVWTPKSTVSNKISNEGAGEYTEITGSNIEKFCTLTYGVPEGESDEVITHIEMRPDVNYKDDGASICDGRVYVKDYVAVTPEALANEDENLGATYLNLADKSNIAEKSPKADLFFYDASGVPQPAVVTNFHYVDAVTAYTGVSNAATVINKSTSPVIVTAEVTMIGTEGLKFLDIGAEGLTTDANVWFSITANENYTGVKDDAPNQVTIGSTDFDSAKGTAKMAIPAAQYEVIKYQDDSTVNATGSHNYYQYVGPNPVFSSASFYLTGRADDREDANTAWDTYIAKVTSGEYVKPKVEVVYTIQEAIEVVGLDDTISYKVKDDTQQTALLAAQQAYEDAIVEVEAKKAAYDTAYATYLAKKALDDAQAKIVEKAIADEAIAKAQSDNAIANGTEAAVDDSANPLYQGYLAAQEATEDAKAARYADGSGDSVDVTTDAGTGASGTFKDLEDAITALDGAKTALATAQGAYTTAKTAYDTALAAGTPVTDYWQ